MSPSTLDVQPTPNPNAIKFTLGSPTTDGSPKTYRNASEAEGVPLARELFAIPGVVYVFMTANFISVNKSPESQWEAILPKATLAIGKHFGLEDV
jgi:scaffold Nfu/NifU family protein